MIRVTGGRSCALIDALPAVLTPDAPPPSVRVPTGARHLADLGSVLMANNPYALDHVLGPGSRPRLDGGRLGIVT